MAEGIKQLSTDYPNVPVTEHQKKAYAQLMRVKENYKTNRYLVRRDKTADWPIFVWAGTSFPGARVVIWGEKDALFPVPIHSSFVTNFFRPSRSLKLLPDAAHITPEDAPKEISEFLLEAFGQPKN